MVKHNLPIRISQLAAIVSVAVTASIGISFAAQAVPKLNVENRGAPNQTAGAASRSSSSATLIALQGPSQETLTVAASPTIFIYVSDTNASEGVFVIRDANENNVGQVTVALPDRPGIVRVQLPENLMSQSLQVGEKYQWLFSPLSENSNGINTTFVNGWIQRTELSPNQIAQLNNADPLAAVDLYVEAELWHDALTTLADLREANPNNPTLEAKWNNVLTEVGLGSLAGTSVNFARTLASNH